MHRDRQGGDRVRDVPRRGAPWESYAAALLLAVGVSTAGCATTGPAREPVRLVAGTAPRELDIPVPSSFRFAEDGSEDFRSGRRRVYVRHRYFGSADKQSVRQFFEGEMPLARWRLVNSAALDGRYTLRFEKEAEVCEIIVSDATRGRGGPTMIDIRITPRETADTPTAQKTPS